ncbi:MAG TPA: hypothetical protein ENJ46_00965 [Hellea balneolensis]|uniref:Uncharacterized protein n=1 Tax=Hellea balneolensis TaxID=287478 RepID=A0A7C3C2C4_9PROT|nr:hypothetical protein [Hellea balneolensis]
MDVRTLPAADCALLRNFDAKQGLVFEGLGVSAFGDRYELGQEAGRGRRVPRGISRRCEFIIERTGRIPFFCRLFGYDDYEDEG